MQMQSCHWQVGAIYPDPNHPEVLEDTWLRALNRLHASVNDLEYWPDINEGLHSRKISWQVGVEGCPGCNLDYGGYDHPGMD